MLAQHWKHFAAFDRSRESIYLPGIGELVGNAFFRDALPVSPQFQLDRMLDIQRIVGSNNASVADNLQRRAIVRPGRNLHCGQCAPAKPQRQCRGRFDVARLLVAAAQSMHEPRLVLQDIAQSVDAVDAHIGDWATARYRAVIEPGAAMAGAIIRELRPREDRAANVASGDALAKSCRAFFKAKHMGHAEQHAGVPRRFDHLAALVCVHAHRFFAKHRLAGGNRSHHVLEVADIGSGDQDGVYFGTATEFNG